MNLDDLMKKAQEIQNKMKQTQDELKDAKVIGQSGGGIVKITFNGSHEALNTELDVTALDDKSLLEELITAAINDGAHKIESQTKSKLADLAGNFQMPTDFKFPFDSSDDKK